MSFKIRLTSVFVAAVLLISGCSLQNNAKTKSLNTLKNSVNKKYAIENVVKTFLPKGSKLISPDNPQGTGPVQMEDIDGDNIPEVIATYKTNSTPEKIRVLLLKQSGESWSQITELNPPNDSATGLDWASFHKFDNGDSKFLVLGWDVSSKNQLDIYKWNKSGITRVFTRQYDKIEIDDFSDDSNKKDDTYEFALWTKDMGDGYMVDLYRFNGTDLVKDKGLYANYYKKVVDYYEQKIRQNPSTSYYYYYLAFAENVENNYIDALAAIKTGKSFQCDDKLMNKFNDLQKEIEKKK